MLAIGRNPVLEALRSDKPVEKVVIVDTNVRDPKLNEIEELAGRRGAKLLRRPARELDQLSEKSPHQGVIAYVDLEIDTKPPQNITRSHIYIREAQDLHNVGAIIRTAEVLGFAVILSPDINMHPTIARVSMGAVFHTPLLQSSLFPTIKAFKDEDLRVYAIERGGDSPIYKQELKSPCLLIIGGEDKSISPEIIAKCDALLTIPQVGKINSLNMSVAAGIAMSEVVRQAQI
jgi:23S rRNA (guanosine2251-2'-O)-methyltransferase